MLCLHFCLAFTVVIPGVVYFLTLFPWFVPVCFGHVCINKCQTFGLYVCKSGLGLKFICV
jgi:hypothetical protein